MFPEVPPGWLTLQLSAQRAKTAEELSRIVDEMNRLLTEYERRAQGDRIPQRRAWRRTTTENMSREPITSRGSNASHSSPPREGR